MRRITEFEKAKRKKEVLGKAKTIFAVIVFTAVALVVYSFRFEITSQGIGVFLKDGISLMFDNHGYPVELEASPCQLTNVGNRVVAVSDTSFEVFNSAGNRVFGGRIDYNNPIVYCNGNRMLLYAQGERELSVRSGEMVIYEMKSETPIYTATVSDNNIIAYSSAQFGYQSAVKALDKNFDEIFVWVSADSIINNLSLNKKGNCLAASGVYFKDGMLCSKLNVFDINNGQEIFNYDFLNDLIIETRILNNGNIMVITDKEIVTLSSNGKLKNRVSFDANILYAYDFDGYNSCVVAIGDYTTQKNTLLLRIDNKGKMTKSANIDGRINGLNLYNDSTVAFSDDLLICYDKNFRYVNQAQAAGSAHCRVVGDYVYCSSDTILRRVHMGNKKEK